MSTYAERVRECVGSCLFTTAELTDGKPPREPVKAECLLHTYGFDPIRLEEHRPTILALLKELVQDEFYVSKGGGWSFLRLPFDREDVQWGEHTDAEALLALGIAIGVASFSLPRNLWSVMPGGMPYIRFDL